MNSLIRILDDIKHCEICKAHLPHGIRPVVRGNERASVLIIGQAPGAKVHASGIPFDDPSGERLRCWMNVDKTTFYDESQIAIVPMGFCYPGKGKSGDLPPRPECAPTWHQAFLSQLPNIKLTLLIGQYSQRYYLGEDFDSLTETVRNWRTYLPNYFPMPHPSPRNQIWLKKNPWFEAETLKDLRAAIADATEP